MISEQILSFLGKVPEKASEHASGISLNILFIVIIIFALWGIGEIIDEYGNYDSPAVPLLFITTFSAGFIFIAVLIVDIIVALAK